MAMRKLRVQSIVPAPCCVFQRPLEYTGAAEFGTMAHEAQMAGWERYRCGHGVADQRVGQWLHDRQRQAEHRGTDARAPIAAVVEWPIQQSTADVVGC